MSQKLGVFVAAGLGSNRYGLRIVDFGKSCGCRCRHSARHREAMFGQEFVDNGLPKIKPAHE